MSTPKRRRSITWCDEAGNEHTDSWMTSSRGASLASIPPELRLVDAYCPQGHLTAVLMPNGHSPPLVMVHRSSLGYPGPMLALTDDGLVAVMVHDSGRQVGALGTPRKSFLVNCPSCPIEYLLDAGALHAAVAAGRKRLQLRRADPAQH